eukprot:814941-Amphidinium_carterae.2
MAEGAPVPCPHLGHVRLLSYGSVTFIEHSITGEVKRLEPGQWSLSFDAEGDGVLEGRATSGEMCRMDVADVLERDLFETVQDGHTRRLIQVAGEKGEWLDVAAARITSMRLTLRDGVDELIFLVYRHFIPKTSC